MALATSERSGIATLLPWSIRTLLPLLILLVLLPGVASALDTDGDGLEDAFELANGFDPADPDEDMNGRVDGQDDFDADGLGNAAEAAVGTDPNDPDSDADGLLDGEEIGTGSFGPQQVVDTQRARSVFAADLDGDGDIDLVSGDPVDDVVAWYENTDGSGSFGPQQVINSPPDVQWVIAADVDGDGDVDALHAGNSGGTFWYENTDGSGAFGPPRSISTAIADAIFAADVDGDGDVDLLSASANLQSVDWYENTDGAGSFGPAQAIGAMTHALSVVAGDADGDGDLDALSASYIDHTIAWYENTDGLGSFGAQQAISTLAAGRRAVFADVDGDGDLDVLSATPDDDTIAWYENTDGAGTFGPQQAISTLADGAWSVLAADLDGDGDLDALSTSVYDDKLAWYENTDGAGTFGPQQLIATLAGAGEGPTAADLDGDGDLDVVTPEVTITAWYEQVNVANPLDSDSDDDGLPDELEVNILGTSALDPDTDDDGLLDPVETNTGIYASPSDTGTDPLDPDSDDDGLLDGVETNTGSYVSPSDTGTDPLDFDTDDDGIEDGPEVHLGFDPFDDTSTPPLPLPECADTIDNDGDGLVDFPEDFGCDSYEDPTEIQDMDGDGTLDSLDFCMLEPDAPSPCGFDTDLDGYGNHCDGDFNNDGVTASTDAGVLIADLQTGFDSGGRGTDMNCDGVVNSQDAQLWINQANGTGVPGPSGLPCAGSVPCP